MKEPDGNFESLSETTNIPSYFELAILEEDSDNETMNRVGDKMPTLVSLEDYECKRCKFTFSSAGQLREHTTFHSEARLICHVCSKKFKTVLNFQIHLNEHNGLPLFKCDMCNKTFKFRASYEVHMMLHTNKRPYQCEVCDKLFRTCSSLTVHSRIHDDIRNFECKVCGKKYREANHLKAHEYTHTAKGFKCDLCHQRYSSSQSLKLHRSTVHSINYRFYCSQCQRQFKLKHQVIRHLRTHYKQEAKVVEL